MKEHHHNSHHGNGHHRKSSSSAHIEHINILDQLGNSLKDELKRGLSLIDTSVNQLAQAKWILINIEKTLEGGYTDCPACHENKSKNSIANFSPPKSKHSDHGVVKKEQSPVETVKDEVRSSNKPGPKSKTKIKKPPSSVLSVTQVKEHEPPCNYSREQAMSSTTTVEKDKPLVKLSDISNVIKGRRRVHLSDYPSLQRSKKKKRKISVSNEEISDSESCTVINYKKRNTESESYSMSSSKKRKHSKSSPVKKFKSKEIIESDDDSSSDGERVSITDMLKKKKHKHKHEKHHKHHSKSKVKEIGGKSSFFDKISIVSDITDRNENTKTSKSEKHHSVKESGTKSSFEKVTTARSDVTDKSDSSIRPTKPSQRHLTEKTTDVEKTRKPDKEVKNVEKEEEREPVPEKKSKKEDREPISENQSKREEREPVLEKKSKKEDREPIPENQSKKEEREPIPEKQPKKDEKMDIKAMLLSKAKPDLIKQRLLEKFKQFTAARKAAPETKVKVKSGEAEDMEAIGQRIEKEPPKDTNKENFKNSILSSIQTPMALQDMIEQDEINDKRNNSIDSVDEFIQSVLHNNNDSVTEREILRILKDNYSMNEGNKSVELKAETQIKFKQVIGQFQNIVVANLQGGNKAGSGSEGSPNSDGASNVEGAQGSSDGNTVTNNEQGNIVILNDSQLPSGELTIGNYFLIGREGYPLQLMKYVGGNNFEPLQMSNFTPQQLSVMKNSLM